MAIKDDLVIGAAIVGAAWYFVKYMRTAAINTVTDLIPAVSPPGFTDLQNAMVATDIHPVNGNPSTFTSGLADYVTGYAAGTTYAIQPNDQTLYIVLNTGEWADTPYTKNDLIKYSTQYYRQLAGL